MDVEINSLVVSLITSFLTLHSPPPPPSPLQFSNDASVSVVKESSAALGQGFRVGFLGRLHMDVFRQRLEEEHSSTVINTAPTVPYKFKRFCPRSKTMIEETIKNPADFPEGDALARVETFMEPMVLATVIFPAEYTGAMMELCSNHRGEQIDCNYLDANRAIMKYKLP